MAVQHGSPSRQQHSDGKQRPKAGTIVLASIPIQGHQNRNVVAFFISIEAEPFFHFLEDADIEVILACWKAGLSTSPIPARRYRHTSVSRLLDNAALSHLCVCGGRIRRWTDCCVSTFHLRRRRNVPNGARLCCTILDGTRDEVVHTCSRQTSRRRLPTLASCVGEEVAEGADLEGRRTVCAPVDMTMGE